MVKLITKTTEHKGVVNTIKDQMMEIELPHGKRIWVKGHANIGETIYLLLNSIGQVINYMEKHEAEIASINPLALINDNSNIITEGGIHGDLNGLNGNDDRSWDVSGYDEHDSEFWFEN